MPMSELLVTEFVERWHAVGGHIFQAADTQTVESLLARAVLGALAAVGDGAVSRTVLYETGAVGVTWDQVTRGLGGMECVRWNGSPRMRSLAVDAVAGITSCAWAVASTGSVILYHGDEQGLLPSVLPPAHIVVIQRDQIVATVSDALKRIPRPIPRMMKIISGPSMTADIEATLVMGVHGPQWVAAVIC